MKRSNLWLSILLLAGCVACCSVQASPLAAGPKRKSKNLQSEAAEASDSHGDLIPIPDNLLKKPAAPKKVSGKTALSVILSEAGGQLLISKAQP
jgi:hypothetical protein